MISVLAIWWCPCVESSLVLLEEGVCYDQCVLLAKLLLAFALPHFVLQGQICLLLQVSLDFLLLHSSPLWWKGHLFWVFILEVLVGLCRTVQFHFLWHYCFRHRLGLLWYWMVCLGNEQRSLCHFWGCTQILHGVNSQMFKLSLEKAEEPEIKLPTSVGSSKKEESSRKTSTSALLPVPKSYMDVRAGL